MASNLPGFLRRTLRSVYSDDDDEDLEGGVAGEEITGTITSSSTNDTHEQQGGNELNRDEDDLNALGTQLGDASIFRLDGDKGLPEDVGTATPFNSLANIQMTNPSGGGGGGGGGSLKQDQEPRQKTYRETQFEKILAADVVNLEELRKLSWNGIPNIYRAASWKILLGYVPTNASRRTASIRRRRREYQDSITQFYDIPDDTRTSQEQETLRQVLVDVPRTAPEVQLFRNDRIRRSLSRLLYIWAMRHPASSYVQGINDLSTPLLVVFLSDYYDGEDVLEGHVMNQLSDEQMEELEADVYGCLTNLLAGIQDHYTSDQPGVQRMVMRLEELVNRIDKDLCEHLRETGIEFIQFAFKWMNCLLLREFQLKCVVRLWDTYISEKESGFEGFHVYVCAAFLCQFSSQLQAMTFDELFGFMQDMPTSDWTDTEIEMLLSQAYVLSTLFGGSDAHLTSSNP
mmetsp:Transcript_800/g.1475  ORF Transcript_800/g.1475 Transcript_800/m.1475 type:complete len:457 (+) Transcript_800:160-1530(+)